MMNLNGLSIKRQNDILNEMLAEAQLKFSSQGEVMDASSDSILGIFLNVFSSQIADIWLGLQEVYDAFNPSTNEGKNLIDSCALSGITKLDASNTKVFCTLYGDKETKIPVGFELKCSTNNEIFTNEQEFSLIEPTENSDIFKATGLFSSKKVGPIICPKGKLTGIPTAPNDLKGLKSANNENEPISIGRLIETDAELRIRRAKSGAIIGQNVIQALQAKLLDVIGVSTVLIIENSNMYPINAMPPKSFQIIIDGGNDTEIAQTIWNNKPAGIETYGKTSVPITTSTGQTQNICITRPSDVPIHVRVFYTISKDETFPEKGEELITQAIISYGKKLGINADIINQRFFGNIFSSCPGILSLDLQVSKDGVSYSNEVSLEKTEYPTFIAEDIIIKAVKND